MKSTPHDLVLSGLVQQGLSWVRGHVVVDAGVVTDVVVADPLTPTAYLPVPSARRHLDYDHCLLLPGMVDAHVHSLSHAGEGIAASTSAAAAGGVTTIVEMPFDHSGPINRVERLQRKIDLAENEAHVDVALLGTLEPGGGWRRLDDLVEAGASGFKVSLFNTDSDRFPRIDDGELVEVFTAAAANDRTVCVHAEIDEIVRPGIERLRAAGEDPAMHAASRPPISETLGVLTAAETALHTGAAVHICHASLPRSVDLVRRWAEDGADITLETCPHYLLADEGDVRDGRWKINPPLRGAADRHALWDRLADGRIEVVSSDHAPWPVEWKTKSNVFDNHSGAPGVETGYPMVLGQAWSRGPETFAAALAAMTSSPAARFGLDARKGSLLPGFDADVVVLDPEAPWTIDEGALHSNAGWSPYHGRTTFGRIHMTMLRGEIVWDGELRAGPGAGSVL